MTPDRPRPATDDPALEGRPGAPLWKRIHEVLSAEIDDGRWPPGAKLPAESALARRFGVNRHTLRRAIAALRDEGRVHVRRGAGATVTQTTTDYPLGLRPRFSAALRAAGRRPAREILATETAAARREEAAALGLDRGATVHVADTVSRADGVPVAMSRACWPAEPLPGFLDALRETGSITAALAVCGVHDYTRRWTRLTARRPGALVARMLKISDATPVLHAESLSVDAAGRPVEYALTWICTDRLPLVVGDDPDGGPFFG